MLCRNRVSDFDRWLKIFASHRSAHVDAGLILERLWRASEEPDQIFFLFRVDDIEKARSFISAPAASDAADESGVIDGEYYLVESMGGY
jgi:hypothetical protein